MNNNPQASNGGFDQNKFNAILSKYNYTPPAQPGQPQDWYTQIKQRTNPTPVAPATSPGDEAYSKYSDVVNKVAGDTFAPIQQAGENVAQDASDYASGDQSLTNLGLSGADVAGHIAKGVVGAISAPVGDAIAATTDAAGDNKTVQDIAQNPTVGKGLDAVNATIKAASDKAQSEYAKFKAAFPTAARVAEDAGNVGNLLALFEGGKGATQLAERTGDAVTTGIENTKELLNTPPVEVGDQTANAKALADATAAKNKSGVVDLLKQNEDTMTPTMKKEAIDEGRQTITKTKTGGTKVDYAPTKEVTRASEILSDPNEVKNPVSPKDKPDVVYSKVKDAIAEKGDAAEKYLEANPVKITNKEDADLFGGLREKAAKVSTDTEMKAYDEQIKLFQKQLQGRGGYDTSNYYKALKDWEQNIADKLPRGKDALLDPTGVANAKIRAASDIRTAVRDMIGDKHPEFKPRMYDLASLYEVKDNSLLNASKESSKNIFEKHPVATKVGALLGADKIIKATTGLGI